jgi:hypothetical protein
MIELGFCLPKKKREKKEKKKVGFVYIMKLKRENKKRSTLSQIKLEGPLKSGLPT